MSDWSNDKVLQFIELYSFERLLWDPQDKNYKTKHKIKEAWRRISRNLGDIPIEELKAKKKSLMATFRPLVKKKIQTMRSGVDADDVFQPIWFAYDAMESFLGHLYDVEETATEEPVEEVVHDSDTMLPEPSPSQPKQIKNKTNFIKKRIIPQSRLKEAEKRINESFRTLNKVLEKKSPEEDECDIYGKLLAKKLRKYPERLRNRVMYQIDGLLLDNPYPEERPSSSNSAQSPTYQYYPNTPSPVYIIASSPTQSKKHKETK